MSDLILKDECRRLIGACFEVYLAKACGFPEDVPQEGPELELSDLGIPFVAQKEHPLAYKGHPLRKGCRSDCWRSDAVVMEIKAVERLTDEHRAQRLNHLNATGAKLGLLVNFGHYPEMEWERSVR